MILALNHLEKELARQLNLQRIYQNNLREAEHSIRELRDAIDSLSLLPEPKREPENGN